MKKLSKVPLTFDLALIGGECKKHAQQYAGNGKEYVAIAIYRPKNRPENLDFKPLANPKIELVRKEYWYRKVRNKRLCA